jgi:hypothetical protein
VATADDQRDATQGISELTAAIRAHDTKAIARLMRAPVTSTGVWFPDAACEKRFGKPGTILVKELEPFARCLAQLRPQVSTRKAGQRDGAVLTYDPGIELHVAFYGPLVRAIGFEAQTSADTGVPTLTVQAFEELRTAGTTLLDDKLASSLRAEAATKGSVSAWMKVCIGATGAITNAWTVKSTTTSIGEAFRVAIADWTFKPLEIHKVAMPACGLWLLTYPAAKAPPVETLPAFDQPRVYEIDDIVADDMWTDDLQVQGIPPPPPQIQNVTPTMLETLRVAGSKKLPATPSQRKAMVAAGKTRVLTSFKLCVDVRGKVSSITLLKTSGFPDYDALLTAGIRRWGYRPYRINGAATPVCTAVTFSYDSSSP